MAFSKRRYEVDSTHRLSATEYPAGLLYLAMVCKLYSSRMVGRSMDEQNSGLLVEAMLSVSLSYLILS